MAMKILIAEDNTLVALDLEQQVTDAGHIVVSIAGTSRRHCLSHGSGCRSELDLFTPITLHYE
jgi:hypothetical protein